MKLNKLFLGLLGVAAFTLASCSEDDSYEKATVSGPQVFFSDTTPTEYEISPDATSFNVPISRADASGALTVNLTSTTENPMYSIPSSVSFNDGSATANITVSYDPTKIEYGRYDNLTVKIADDAQATAWGVQELSFTAGVTDWGPWEKWNSTGTADYYYSGSFFGGDDPDLPFVYRHNMIKTNLYQFKLSKWGYGVDLIVDYDEETGYVTCAKQWSGYDHSSYGYVYVEDLNAYRAEKDAAPVASGYGSFDKEQGIITIPLAYVVDAGTFGYDPEYIYIDGYVRADYTLDVAYAGIFTDVAGSVFAVGKVDAGPDVTEISSIVVEASADPSAVADAIAAGDVEATVSEIADQIYVPVTEGLTGKLQIVSAVIVDGEVKSVANAPFEYYGGAASPWESIGIGLYTDDMVYPLYTEDGSSATYEVEIEENKDYPGLYRLVDPYGPNFPYYAYAKSYTSAAIEVDATDPEAVYIFEQTTGLDLGDGEISILSEGGNYYAYYGPDYYDALKTNGYFGKLENGVITFPSFNKKNDAGEVQYTYQGWASLAGTGDYRMGRNGEWKIVLPEAVTASARAKAAKRALARSFAHHLNAFDKTKSRVKKHVRLMLVPNK